METEKTKLETNLKKLASNARAIVTNQVGFPIGCVKMARILFWMYTEAGVEGEKISGKYIRIFDAYYDETDALPKGTERLHWDRDALKKKDEILWEVNQRYRDQVLDICFDIIEQYGETEET
ncbi:MAG: hypothetical protein GY861_22910 [bacterium]|nr:hypothetical protein [bacterium]